LIPVIPATTGQVRQTPKESVDAALYKKFPEVHVLAPVTQAVLATLGTCPELQATGAADPPAQIDPDVQG
jgi:hypothetical protein